jgi:signal peptidase I
MVIVACLIWPRLLLGEFLAVPLLVLLVVLVWIDSFMVGRRSQARLLGSSTARYAGGVVLLLLSALWFEPGFSWVPDTLEPVATPWYRTVPAGPVVGLVHLLHHHAFFAEGYAAGGGNTAMSPAIQPEDRFIYYPKDPVARWSIVVVQPPDNPLMPLILRVVGLPGERVEIDNGKLLINKMPVRTPASMGEIKPMPLMSFNFNGSPKHPVQLKDGEYFLLGDNTANSPDSRIWRSSDGHAAGAVDRRNIVGRVGAVFWPPQRWSLF